MKHLTERRKADRAAMMAGVEDLLKRFAVPYHRTETELAEIMPRRLSLELTLPRGLQLTVDFDGDSPQPDCHVLSWHISTASSACLSNVFQSVNNYHFQKATDIAEGYAMLLAVLDHRIAAAQDGTAFSEARETDFRERREAGVLPWQSAGKTAEEMTEIWAKWNARKRMTA